ncbi:hypothetical protein XENORESO_013971 [Xenotaenia resolanae]|uniref:Wntless-like transmembrane domain-containing protein n=1 Tax=Xenotaenia resolanae TaxID=208358 RepID=A0ABV0W7H9_9TELE
MLVTLACAAMTIIFFIISQVNEGHWHWGDHTVQMNSAFFTGIYGMWNLYVFAIMFLYAPSHKRYGDEQSSGQCIAGNYTLLLTLKRIWIIGQILLDLSFRFLLNVQLK